MLYEVITGSVMSRLRRLAAERDREALPNEDGNAAVEGPEVGTPAAE